MINFYQENEIKQEKRKEKQKKSKKRLKLSLKITLFFILFIIISFSTFSIQTIDSNSEHWYYKLPIIGQIKHLAESADRKLKGEERDRINILLLGMGGDKHNGAYLTDTIILVSIQPSTKKVSMLSIPRDLIVPIENSGWRKINNINAFAEFEKPGSGGLAISQALGDLLDMPIDYYIRLDFQGFINIINEIGGINVYVDHTLEDYKYPIMGKENIEPYEARFEHLYIEKGYHKMNGELALKYARSRHGLGIEGSDFARAKRQQKIIQACKDKLLSKNLLYNPKAIAKIFKELNNHIKTNLKIWEIIKLWKIVKNIDKTNIKNKVLDDSPNGLLVAKRSVDGAYILTPRSGDFDEIKYLSHNVLSDAPQDIKKEINTEKASLEIRNGTWINGLASRTALDLEKYNFNIVKIGNCSRQNFQKSVIYDLTYGEKIKSLTLLKEKTKANVSFNLPQWLINDISQEIGKQKNIKKPDFILILGRDADDKSSGTYNQER